MINSLFSFFFHLQWEGMKSIFCLFFYRWKSFEHFVVHNKFNCEWNSPKLKVSNSLICKFGATNMDGMYEFVDNRDENMQIGIFQQSARK